MTEKEWLKCADPAKMLLAIRDSASLRKLALFAVGCCRQDQELMRDRQDRRAIEWAERFADRQLSPDDRRGPSDGDCYLMAAAANRCLAAGAAAITGDAEETYRYALETAGLLRSGLGYAPREVMGLQVTLCRDIFGNPYRLVKMLPAWRTSTVTALARTSYKSRCFDALPILADAIEDAGCNDAAILQHLRGPGPHTRGCWPLDLILGEE